MNIDENIILLHYPIREALNILDALDGTTSRTLFVVNDDRCVLGSLTDGDVRRGLLNGTSIDEPVERIMNENFRFIRQGQYDIQQIESFSENKIGIVPVLDYQNRLVKLLDMSGHKTYVPVDAVIMAGGRGERLRPFTDTLPKPLLKIGNKPIIEHSIDRLSDFGVSNIYITIRYLGEKLVEYLKDGSSKDIRIQYIREEEALGTIGAVSLIPSFESEDVLVMNSDLLTTIDYRLFYKKFILEQADMAVATIPHHISIPFAVLETNSPTITSIKEKPTFTYQCNAGIYLVKKKLLDKITPNRKLDATEFIEQLITEGHKVVYYPILEYWLDIGSKEDFIKAQSDIQLLNL